MNTETPQGSQGESAGAVDYDESGSGPTVVLVPGSCSTGAAWRPIAAAANGGFRFVTTSLLGYGGTTERRTKSDPAMSYETAAIEQVISRAGSSVHLVGHSHGALVAVAVALRSRAPLTSLTVIEAPAMELLRDRGEPGHYETFRRMTESYFAAFAAGDADAIGAMIDFYGGTGTFASWPRRVRDYAVETTAVNILDWATAYGFALTAASLAAVNIPVLVICGSRSPAAMQRANALLSQVIPGAALVTIEGAAHFMIATHPEQVSRLIAEHVGRAEGSVRKPRMRAS